MSEKFYTIKEAAKKVSLSDQRIRQLINLGRLATKRSGEDSGQILVGEKLLKDLYDEQIIKKSKAVGLAHKTCGCKACTNTKNCVVCYIPTVYSDFFSQLAKCPLHFGGQPVYCRLPYGSKELLITFKCGHSVIGSFQDTETICLVCDEEDFTKEEKEALEKEREEEVRQQKMIDEMDEEEN